MKLSSQAEIPSFDPNGSTSSNVGELDVGKSERGSSVGESLSSPKSTRSSEMTSRSGDGSIGDIASPSGRESDHEINGAFKVFNLVDLSSYFHKGVPVWRQNGQIYYDDGNVLHTYYPSCSEANFSCPFVSSHYDWHAAGYYPGEGEGYHVTQKHLGKGVLSNYYAGCESVSEVLSSLLGDGFFSGFPWSSSIGYSFRGGNIPRLVFVYTNEFDNSLIRT